MQNTFTTERIETAFKKVNEVKGREEGRK